MTRLKFLFLNGSATAQARVVTILYWILLFTATHLPLAVGALPANSDKVLHCAAFAVLTFLTMWSLEAKHRIGFGPRLRVFAAIAAYACVDETLQMIPVLNRHGDLADWIADCSGIVVGFIVFDLCAKIWGQPSSVGSAVSSLSNGDSSLSD
jgi:hypothetical protein